MGGLSSWIGEPSGVSKDTISSTVGWTDVEGPGVVEYVRSMNSSI